MPSCHHEDSSLPITTGRKRALLIGINYVLQPTVVDYPPLDGPHKDAKDLQRLLIEQYDYEEGDITMLLDEPGFAAYPTRTRILSEIANLVRDVDSGDTLVFYFAGHSDQLDNPDGSEDDGMDEVLLPMDHEGLGRPEKFIRDNDLRRFLVDPLPVGARLVAIFDSCHSGTLLDLDHYECNEIYKPWISKGPRRFRSQWMNVVRRQAKLMTGRIITGERVGKHRVKTDEITLELQPMMESPDSDLPPRRFSMSRKTLSVQSQHTIRQETEASINELINYGSTAWQNGGQILASPHAIPAFQNHALWNFGSPIDFQRCMSPDPIRKCTGDCIESPTARASVISLSACMDDQRAWEKGDGETMTQALIEILRQQPTPSFHDLMSSIGFRLHSAAVERHQWSKRQYRRHRANEKRKRRKSTSDVPPSFTSNQRASSTNHLEETLEMINFQDPQLGSLKRLNMQDRFTL
ncbi:caspase domain-containing protein [Abortiporus biennis]|nr:caspase domain-containing protein [Abortiporus biennis]